MYKLKSSNGKVKALLRTGEDLVKSELTVSSAQHIIDVGKMEESDVTGYPIKVDNWYFEGDEIREPKKFGGKKHE